jgi:putative heme transporter
MSTPQVAERTRKPLGWKRIVGYTISIAIVVAIFWWAIPKFANYGDVWAAIKTLTPFETWSLVGATVFNLVTYWWANQAALPGLGIGKAAVLTQTTTSVANTLPAGGAIAVGLTYSILDSWGFTGTSVALYVGVTGIWNIFTKLALPMLALVFLALSGHLTTTYILAALFGIVVLGVAVGLFTLLFRSEAFAVRIGNWMGRVVSWFRRLLHKPPVTTWGDGAARFRRDTIVLVERRWLRLSVFTVLSQVALFLVLLLSLRGLGVSEQEVSTAEAFAVYAFSRLLSAVPITPGGVGLIDLGYIGGLTAFSGEEKAAIVAAVLLFRALTYAIQIPIGGFTYIVWRVKSDWRRPVDAAAQRDRSTYFALDNGSARVRK